MKLKRFNDEFLKILNISPRIDRLHKIQHCKHDFVKLVEKSDLVFEMQDDYPIPKNLLSFLIEVSKKNEWCYANEFTFGKILSFIKNSINLKDLKFDIEKVERIRFKELLFICLPSRIDVWKKKLKFAFSDENIIENLFSSFNGQIGVFGTYSNGYVIIVNSDFIKSNEDAEEIIEHELVHLFKCIDDSKDTVSESFKKILLNEDELETYTINLMNRLQTLYDRKTALFSDEKDTQKNRKAFLDEIFYDASTMQTYQDVYLKWHEFDESELLEINIWFLWSMCHWEPDEYKDFKMKIYSHFERFL